jgi:hypothetical protein
MQRKMEKALHPVLEKRNIEIDQDKKKLPKY